MTNGELFLHILKFIWRIMLLSFFVFFLVSSLFAMNDENWGRAACLLLMAVITQNSMNASSLERTLEK